MDIPRQIIRVNETMFEGFGEHISENELIIPDYFPEVLKVIKTEAVPRVKSRNVEEDKLIIEGTIEFRIMYVSQDSKTVRCIINNSEFAHKFDIKNLKTISNARTRLKVEFVGCRLLNPRKAMLKAVLGIAVKVWTQKELEAVKYADLPEIQMLNKNISIFDVVATGEKSFKLTEELELGQGKPEAEYILKNDVNLSFKDLKVISNKVIAKGEALVKTMYAPPDNKNVQITEQNIPFSQIIDMEGVDEDCECDVRFDVTDFKAGLKEDMEGQNKIIQVEIGCMGFARAIKNIETSIVTDAYNTKYQMDTDSKTSVFEKYLDKISSSMGCKDSIKIDDGVSSVIDVTATPVISSVGIEDKSLLVSGNIEASVLAVNSDGDPFSCDKSIPFNYSLALKEFSEQMRCEPEISITSVDYIISGENEIDIRVQLNINASLYGNNKETYICSLNVDEQKIKVKDKIPVLTLYFAQKDERIWDIAKKYDASPYAIKHLNGIETDALTENKMLIVQRKYQDSKIK